MFFIAGKKGTTSTLGSGTFYCPECNTMRGYSLKAVKDSYTLFFVPVVSGSTLGRYVECQNCRSTFKESVLNYKPEAEKAQFKAEYHKAIKRVMILMMMRDGSVAENEIETIRIICSDLSGSEVAETEIKEDIEAVKAEGMNVKEYLKGISPYLNDKGKEMIIKAAYSVASADQIYKVAEQELMADMGDALNISRRHLKAVIEDFISKES